MNDRLDILSMVSRILFILALVACAIWVYASREKVSSYHTAKEAEQALESHFLQREGEGLRHSQAEENANFQQHEILVENEAPARQKRQNEQVSGFEFGGEESALAEKMDSKQKDASDAFFKFLDKDQETLIGQRYDYLSYPPQGKNLGRFDAQIFYYLQKRYAHVDVKAVINSSGVYIYGATLCEKEKNNNVILEPCIFMQQFPMYSEKDIIVSPLENELSRAIQISSSLVFFPWARYATSYLDCSEYDSKSDYFRISIQFGKSDKDIMVSLAVPYSDSAENALFGLMDSSKKPCRGLELFFKTPDLVELLLASLQAKNVCLKNAIRENQ